jgi:UDPglucose 6-dehydrogenase
LAAIKTTVPKITAMEDAELQDYLTHKPLNLKATLDKAEAYTGADFVVIATPTNYDPVTPTTLTPAA